MEERVEYQESSKELEELSKKGYTIVSRVFSEEKVQKARQLFFDWIENTPDVLNHHLHCSFQGLMKFGEVGHQKHAWMIKTDPDVQRVFKNLWKTEELVTGFDGACWMPEDWVSEDVCWTHTDQSAAAKGLTCIQGFVSLSHNTDRSFVVYEGSHLLHESYMRQHGFTGARNWRLIDQAYLETIQNTRKVLHVKAGDLVLWDSRTFHQNQFGSLPEERLVQYVCFLPKHHPSNTPGMQRTRKKYFEKRRTTSHWPYPLSVNSAQPPDQVLQVSPVDLSEYESEIKKLL
jgi:hypothetical protein